MQAFTLTYMPEPGDLAEASATSPRLRRSRNRAVRNAASSLLVMMLFGVIEICVPEKPPATFLIMFLCAGLFVKYTRTLLILSTRWGMRRGAEKVGSRSEEAKQVHEATVTEDGLTVRTSETACSYAWDAFGAFVETERQFILLDASGEPAFSLPKRGFADPSLVPVCRRLVAEHCRHA
ncbi:YcxB family protein [Streptomyces sp. NPDC093064]|uniref:YcxB family protein n=1 Tax=unclassified Streptomyces TaxID=2593676 RepID=UPI00342D9031